MLNVISVVFWGLVLLTVIIFIHEVGHFTAARIFGLRVKEFMIGLPGPKVFFKRKDTRYGVTAIPLGGYCLIAGMEKGEDGPDLEKALAFIAYFGSFCEDQADRAEEQLDFDLVDALDTLSDWGTVRRYKSHHLYHYVISAATIDGVSYEEGESRKIADLKAFLASERKQTFISLSWWKRVVILLAGAFSNMVVAMVILIAVLMINGSQNATTTVDTVVDNSPAAAVGLMPGDQIVSIDGTSFDTWQGFTDALGHYNVGDTVSLGYIHNEQQELKSVKLADNNGSPMIGITSRIVRQPIGFLDAASLSVSLIGMTFMAIMQLFNPATFASTIGQTSSVVGISMEASAAASAGPLPFIVLIAALSISIGFMNLLPIPPLDGGKIIVETIERIARRRLPVSVINGISMAGFAAMILLFVVATNSDIHRYFLGG